MNIVNPVCSQAYSLVMGMLWKRLNDHGKNWRHVYKVRNIYLHNYAENMYGAMCICTEYGAKYYFVYQSVIIYTALETCLEGVKSTRVCVAGATV